MSSTPLCIHFCFHSKVRTDDKMLYCSIQLNQKDFRQQDQFTIKTQSNDVGKAVQSNTHENLGVSSHGTEYTSVAKRSNRNVLIKVGQLVLAKQKFSSPWPSRIVAIKKESVDVYFFGDGRCGSVKKCNLFSICESKEIIVNCMKRNLTNYRKGIIEMERISGVPDHLSLTNFV